MNVTQSPWVVHGWTVFAHPLFLAQLDDLTRQVEALFDRGTQCLASLMQSKYHPALRSRSHSEPAMCAK